ncbi:MAG: ZIP family metal transporter [Coxiellaceae bacterium]|nr:MAG: ZIP family metal transporter [Coxiellaceae bacterium]
MLQISEPHYHDEKRVTALLLLIILSIHSLIEGGAVGINTSMSEAVVIYLAIMAHKGSASFALAANLRKTSMQFRTLILMIVFFSLMSPLGIIIAATITTLLQDNTGKLIEACFNAFAAGTFLYIGARHLMEKEHAEFTHTNQISEFSVVVLGILLMAILAIWI